MMSFYRAFSILLIAIITTSTSTTPPIPLKQLTTEQAYLEVQCYQLLVKIKVISLTGEQQKHLFNLNNLQLYENLKPNDKVYVIYVQTFLLPPLTPQLPLSLHHEMIQLRRAFKTLDLNQLNKEMAGYMITIAFAKFHLYRAMLGGVIKAINRTPEGLLNDATIEEAAKEAQIDIENLREITVRLKQKYIGEKESSIMNRGDRIRLRIAQNKAFDAMMRLPKIRAVDVAGVSRSCKLHDCPPGQKGKLVLPVIPEEEEETPRTETTSGTDQEVTVESDQESDYSLFQSTDGSLVDEETELEEVDIAVSTEDSTSRPDVPVGSDTESDYSLQSTDREALVGTEEVDIAVSTRPEVPTDSDRESTGSSDFFAPELTYETLVEETSTEEPKVLLTVEGPDKVSPGSSELSTKPDDDLVSGEASSSGLDRVTPSGDSPSKPPDTLPENYKPGSSSAKPRTNKLRRRLFSQRILWVGPALLLLLGVLGYKFLPRPGSFKATTRPPNVSQETLPLDVPLAFFDEYSPLWFILGALVALVGFGIWWWCCYKKDSSSDVAKKEKGSVLKRRSSQHGTTGSPSTERSRRTLRNASQGTTTRTSAFRTVRLKQLQTQSNLGSRF